MAYKPALPLSPFKIKEPVLGFNSIDQFVGSPEVYALDDRLFHHFIRSKDATMVLFYDDKNEMAYLAKNSLQKAVELSKREDRAFGAVDCAENETLCLKERAYKLTLPTFKLYSGGAYVNRFEYSLPAKDISRFLDLSPPPLPPHTGFRKKLCGCFGGGTEE